MINRSVGRCGPLAATFAVLAACGGKPAEPAVAAPVQAGTAAVVSIVPKIAYSSVPEQHQSGDNAVSVLLTDTDGTAISDAAVTATYFMPAMPSMSMPEMRDSFVLAPQGNGRYAGNVRLSMGGTWIVTVVAKRGEEPVGRRVFNIVAK
jgi:hypothetical protein